MRQLPRCRHASPVSQGHRDWDTQGRWQLPRRIWRFEKGCAHAGALTVQQHDACVASSTMRRAARQPCIRPARQQRRQHQVVAGPSPAEPRLLVQGSRNLSSWILGSDPCLVSPHFPARRSPLLERSSPVVPSPRCASRLERASQNPWLRQAAHATLVPCLTPLRLQPAPAGRQSSSYAAATQQCSPEAGAGP